MSLYRDEAIVLRTHKLGEADRIVTLLTRSHGKVRAVGKGVRRTSSKFGSRLEPFMYVDLQLSTGRNLDIVTQAETLGPFGRRICEDYTLYTAGTVMLETADRLVEAEHEPSLQQYWLLVGAVKALAYRDHAPGLVLDSYLLRALAMAGWAPSFTDCARCGEPGPHTAFAVASGGAVCRAC
ncbi:DNA repair protein RecO, partial [Cellulomonas sp. P5_C6]